MSSTRALEKYQYDFGENRTHDTQHHPLSLDPVTLTVGGLCKKPTKYIFELVN